MGGAAGAILVARRGHDVSAVRLQLKCDLRRLPTILPAFERLARRRPKLTEPSPPYPRICSGKIGFLDIFNRRNRYGAYPLSGLPARACRCGLARERLTQHLRCHRPFHGSWHKCVHEAIQSARNYSGPVFPQRVKALGYALLHAHRLHRHGPPVEPELGQRRRVCRRGRASQRPPRPGGFGLL